MGLPLESDAVALQAYSAQHAGFPTGWREIVYGGGQGDDRSADVAHTLIAPFNSLMSRETSLLFEIDSLFPILGNLGKKHR